jgi:hypothetical protein
LQDRSTDFEFLPIDVSLERCQRYHQKRDIDTANGGCDGYNWYLYPIYLSPFMRSAPTLVKSSEFNSDTGNATSGTSSGTITGMTLNTASNNMAQVRGGSAGCTNGISGRAHLDAEL